ncbi:nucleoside-diphosphate-sugar epimerase [Pseudomonas sp. WPR_5_2]|uniref:UDP-glucose 4-epimerase family protein n=1 Tax=Pseudomonas sp. WPR_5_2 TaxID=1907371 RepID=UPI000EAC45EB|nr:SDR family oxidoreductase [Pseudomonas sp. WPR_5_2]RKS23992.1 nucleoside-diphosphate-sugar epimerase [Pseudomonas sp. WPR_5_2]
MISKSILVTGGSGFLGKAVALRLASMGGNNLILPLRTLGEVLPQGVNAVQISDIDGQTDWKALLKSVDVVVHAAARVHVMREQAADALAAFRKVNVEGTLNLARQAADAGVKRFIFISSIKVNGEGTLAGVPFTADDVPNPDDPYGLSKLEAEQGLKALATVTGMEIVIIRPVLVYGPGVKANFLSMMQWLYKGIPLPFGAIRNRRSLIFLDNLVDLIVTCLDHPAAANQTFLASDGDDVSTSDLLRKLARCMGKSAHLVPIPVWLMSTMSTLLGKQALAQRLFGSLQVDLSKNRQLLGWTPPVSLDHGLSLTAQHFLDSRKS